MKCWYMYLCIQVMYIAWNLHAYIASYKFMFYYSIYKCTIIVPEFMLYLTIVWNLLTFSFIQQRYAFFKNPIPAKTPSDLGGSKFVFRHVNFLSKLTFWWLNGFLADGYRTPYEQEHLGHLPKVCTVHVTISNVFWKHIDNILQT